MDDAHAEPLGPLRDLRPYSPPADEPERRAGQVAAEQLRLGPAALPAALAYAAVGSEEVAAAGEDQREREVGDGSVEDARRVGYHDAARAAYRDVDGLVAR